MSDFDLSLIREFQSRPSFYDRNCPRFKDKIYTAREWQEIANKLGYDVSLLKDRMLQLRNRYNLEKRRIEQWQQENPGKVIESPWPLYEHLHFLSKHIRARRSYKRMLQNHSATDHRSNSTSAASGYMSATTFSAGQMCEIAAPFVNGLVDVKMEDNEEDDSRGADSDSGSSGDDSDKYLPTNPTMMVETNLNEHSPPRTPVTPDIAQHQQQHNQRQHNSSTPSGNGGMTAASVPIPTSMIGVRRLETLQQQNQMLGNIRQQSQRHSQQSLPPLTIRRSIDHHQHQQHHNLSSSQSMRLTSSPLIHSSASSGVTTAAASSTPDAVGNVTGFITAMQSQSQSASSAHKSSATAAYSPRELKYAAFGNFITASLLELPQKKALMLVERFTSDVVNLLMQKYDNASANGESTTVGSGIGTASASS